jgi:hypothetical protein
MAVLLDYPQRKHSAVLRREGIYASALLARGKERDAAVHQAFFQKRGLRPPRNSLARENEKLRPRISGFRESWRKLTSSSTFKKRGHAVRPSDCGNPRGTTPRSDHGDAG